MKDTFDLKKFLSENKINEASGKALVDKTETRWVVLNGEGELPTYFAKSYYTTPKRAQNALNDLVEDKKYYASLKKTADSHLNQSDEERQQEYETVLKYKVHEVELKMSVILK